MDAQAILVSSLVGVPFGYCLTRGRMTDPNCIRNQFRYPFQDWRMMKMFLAATATGATALTLGAMTGLSPLEPTHIKALKPLSNFIGGALLGGGMYFTGSCPGTVWAQLGTGSEYAPFVLAGGFLGAGAYGLVDSFAQHILGETHQVHGTALATLGGLLNTSWLTAAIGFTTVLIGGIALLDKLAPNPEPKNEVEKRAWNPLKAGIILGSLQIPSLWLAHTPLGASSAYAALAGGAISLFNTAPSYLNVHSHSAKSVAQVVQDIAMAAGAYYAMKHLMVSSSDTDKKTDAKAETPKTLSTKAKIQYVIGGAVLLFGSRLADGCTSGHGLSGMAQLALSSMVAVAGMFAGGYATAFLFPKAIVN